MADIEDGKFESIRPESLDICTAEWEECKRAFLIYLGANSLYNAASWRKVGQFLKCMGKNHISMYDTFMWKPEVPAMEANADRGIEAHNTIPGEDSDNLDDVFATFDEHFGVHRYRSIKRQDFPKTKHDDKQSLMSFIVELKTKAEYCNYGDKKRQLYLRHGHQQS